MKRLAALLSLLTLSAFVLAPAAQAQQASNQTGTIYGTIVNSQTDAPMAGVRVVGPRVVRTDGGGYDGPCWTPPRRRRVQLGATTDEEGAFRIEAVPPGRHRVAISLPGQRAQKIVTVEAGEGHEVRFTPAVMVPASSGGTAMIRGTVTDAENGKPLRGANVVAVGTKHGTPAKSGGAYRLEVPAGRLVVSVSYIGFEDETKTLTLEDGERRTLNFAMTTLPEDQLETVEVNSAQPASSYAVKQSQSAQRMNAAPTPTGVAANAQSGPPNVRRRSGPWNTESYDRIEANDYKTAASTPLSTFSIDVDAASYANTRRMLCEGRLPPKDAVRIEELINYFDYDYPQPEGSRGDGAPFSITTEVGAAPWNDAHRLVHVGLKGREIAGEAPPSNLVFLLDVSGSMRSPRKLPLLKQSFQRLTERLGPRDRVAIVVYAGSSGLVLESTPGSEKGTIQAALGRLRAGGSTAGAAGIRLAYEVAEENFIEEGNNRVILATDGDFNVGPSSDAEMTRLIEEKRESGVFLTTLGFGTGNFKDSKMEALANTGNGNYYYLDTPREAKKVLGRELTSTLFTIAKDVKIQVEFNPAEVKRYRLIGYVNRLLDKEDFADDSTDAGELGAGHSVTALYEVVPAETEREGNSDKSGLRYQTERGLTGAARSSGELMQVRLRYKQPDADTSRLLTRAVSAAPSSRDADARSENFAFSAAVAGFGMLLRDSEYKGGFTTGQVLALARAGQGADPYGDRAEFIQLVERFRTMEEAEEKPGTARR